MRPTRVVVVDDHPLFAQGTVEILDRLPGVSAEGYALSVGEAVGLVARLSPDVVVCDLMFGSEPEGLELPGRLASAGLGHVQVLFLTQFDNAVSDRRARELGAAGLVSKRLGPEEIGKAIVAVANRRPIERSLVEQTRLEPTDRPRPPSPREAEILSLMAEGASSAQAAFELGISHKTIDTHMARLFERYDVTGRGQLLIFAERRGWLSRPVHRH